MKVFKIILSVLSIYLIISFIIFLKWDFDRLEMYSGLDFQTTEAYKNTVLRIVSLLATFILILSFNFLMWFKNLFGLPLTPEQAAERKQIIAERKKAKLQEKLNKLN